MEQGTRPLSEPAQKAPGVFCQEAAAAELPELHAELLAVLQLVKSRMDQALGKPRAPSSPVLTPNFFGWGSNLRTNIRIQFFLAPTYSNLSNLEDLEAI